jgi:hypothetical protein
MEAGPVLRLTEQEHDTELLVVDTEEPVSFQEAQAHKCWHKAMLDEMTAIEANRTWTLVKAPPDHRPINLKWVFKIKSDTAGIITKRKGIRATASCGLQRGFHANGAARISAAAAGLRGRTVVADPSHGCEIGIPQQRFVGRSLRHAATEIHHRQLGEQTAAPVKGALRTPTGSPRVVCEAGRCSAGS